MLKVKGYIDMNKYTAQLYYTKKIKVDTVNYNDYDYSYGCYDIIRKEEFDLYANKGDKYFADIHNSSLYEILDHELSMHIKENEINKTIAELLNKFLDNSFKPKINKNISLFIILSDIALCCCEYCENHLKLGYIDYSLVRFDFKTIYGNIFNINEIKKYLNEEAQYRVKFIKLDSNYIVALILPFDNNEIANIFKRYIATHQLLIS